MPNGGSTFSVKSLTAQATFYSPLFFASVSLNLKIKKQKVADKIEQTTPQYF